MAQMKLRRRVRWCTQPASTHAQRQLWLVKHRRHPQCVNKNEVLLLRVCLPMLRQAIDRVRFVCYIASASPEVFGVLHKCKSHQMVVGVCYKEGAVVPHRQPGRPVEPRKSPISIRKPRLRRRRGRESCPGLRAISAPWQNVQSVRCTQCGGPYMAALGNIYAFLCTNCYSITRREWKRCDIASRSL